MSAPSFTRRRLLVGGAVLLCSGLLLLLLSDSPHAPDAASSQGVPSPAENELPRPAGEGQPPIGQDAADEAGAASTAAAFVSAMAEATAEPEQRAATLDRFLVPGSEGLRGEAAAGFALLDREVAAARQLSPAARVLVRQVPLSYELDGCSPQRCRVRLWTLGLVAIEGREATETWQTAVIDLHWLSDGWRVAGWSAAPGPVPLLTGRLPTPTNELLAAVGGWKEYRHGTAG